jgi:tetratricopeptide (TPR) repeat protein
MEAGNGARLSLGLSVNTADIPPPAASLENDVARVRELLEQRHWKEAITAAQSVLTVHPTNRDLLYSLAVAQRYAQQIPQALATLARLEAFHPRYPRLFQERGHCHVAQRAAAPAIEAFERAVQMNPALPASWSTLQTLYRMSGRAADSANAADNVSRLKGMPKEIVTAYSMYADGEIYQAEQLVRRYLLTHGDHIEGMRLLAKIGIDQDVVDDAEFLLQNVLQMAPEHHAARYEYAVALLKQHKHIQAQQEIQRLLALDPDNRVCRATDATIWLGLGHVERAIPLYQQLIKESPRQHELHLSIGHALKTKGSQAEAIDAYRKAADLRPDFGEAYWSLANLKTYRFTDDELVSMRAREAAPTIQLADRYHLCFALGKALEDRGEYAESFVYYARGNALKKQESRYRPNPVERNARLQISVCSREFFAQRRGVGCKSAAPIFIVGLPRSGSTLLEQILASHSQVEGTMELAEIPRLVGTLQGRYVDSDSVDPRYPGILTELNSEDFERFGDSYLADTLNYRTGQPRFIDKNPNNFRHIGLIHLILPNAKIIDARRNPMACCFSNFKQLFAAGQEFTYSIEDISRYYATYLQLMKHWDEALPGAVLHVQYEDVVEDLESHVRRILEFCELEFEPACVEFHKTVRRVHTASSEQVRQPINKEGVDQWRHFEPWLKPLQTALNTLAVS